MKKIIMIAIAMVTLNAHAELVNYESASASSKIVKLTNESVDKLTSENQPACIKDGNRIVKTNRTFVKMGLKYGDCSNGDKARERARMKGYTVNVLKLESIKDEKAKALGLI